MNVHSDSMASGETYVAEHYHSFTLPQKLAVLAESSESPEIREFAKQVIANARLTAYLKTVAKWYDGSDEAEHRLATMLAVRFGINWWLDLRRKENVDAMIGTAEGLYHEIHIRPILDRMNTADVEPIDYVTLQQAAGLVNRNKRTLERWKQKDPKFPTPEVFGDNGTADEWLWSTLRPYLESKSRRPLPKIFPAHVVR